MLYEIHMLRNYPPTCLNRDDSGAPKSCTFAGTDRARISSQCLKRTWRTSPMLAEAVGAEQLGVRTRQMPELVGNELRERGMDPAWIDLVLPKLTAVVTNDKENKSGNYTKQIVFYSREDIKAIADAVQSLLQDADGLKAVKERLKPKDAITKQLAVDASIRPVTVDIALFGRMVTSRGFRDVEASMQVAHAISTNRSAVQSDFYTAVDDIISGNPLEESGSGMMGDTWFDSSCYYQYASIDTDALRENLTGVPDADAVVNQVVPALLEAMAYSNPSGKQNTFAGHMLPSAVLVECKERKIPVSLANGFARPAVSDSKGDLIQHSIEKLVSEAERVNQDFQLPVAKRWWFESGYDVPFGCEAQVCGSYSELIEGVRESLTEQEDA